MRKAKQYSRKEIKFKSLAIELEKEVKKIDRESLEQAKAIQAELKLGGTSNCQAYLGLVGERNGRTPRQLRHSMAVQTMQGYRM